MAKCKTPCIKATFPLAPPPPRKKLPGTTWPDPLVTRTLLHCALWLTFIYMLLLTLFEFIELLRPKPRRAHPLAEPERRPPACPVCGQSHVPASRSKRRRCVIL